jgi:GH35 family endo-1,4-beta-xylanase
VARAKPASTDHQLLPDGARNLPHKNEVMFNEYNTEGDTSRTALRRGYTKLKELGLVVAVGMQAHAFSTPPTGES